MPKVDLIGTSIVFFKYNYIFVHKHYILSGRIWTPPEVVRGTNLSGRIGTPPKVVRGTNLSGRIGTPKSGPRNPTQPKWPHRDTRYKKIVLL